MIRKMLFITLMVLSILTGGCGKKTEQASTSTTSEIVVTESSASATTTAAVANPSPPVTSAPSAPVSSAPAAPAVVISSQETNWTGVTAELTEFRRKNNTLTAKIRFRNSGTEPRQPDIRLADSYVMDASAGKKYEALKDEKGTYIGSLRPGYSDRWYTDLKPGEQATIWMKFPAPPAEVKAVTLQLPGVPPFEDVPIQD